MRYQSRSALRSVERAVFDVNGQPVEASALSGYGDRLALFEGCSFVYLGIANSTGYLRDGKL